MDCVARGRSWPKWFIAICACACLIPLKSLRATEHKAVLIIQSVGRDYKPWNEYAAQIRAELERQSPWPLDVREHALELSGSGNLDPELPFVEYLEVLYAGHWPDLIVTIGTPAASFIQRHRDRLFPTAPVLITYIEQRRLKDLSLTQNDAVVAVAVDYRVLLESFLQISPDTRTVAVVNGHSPIELFWRNEIQKDLRPFEGRIEIKWYDDLSFQEILKQTASLPPHSAIYWSTMAVDATGVPYEGDRALTALHATANAPIFTYDQAFFGGGVVGGPMLSAAALGKQAGAVAVRLLGGDKADSINVKPIGLAAPQYDWRELQRWGIGENRLPPNSQVYYRKPSVWDLYRSQVILAIAVVLAQAALIASLLRERQRRQLAEVQVRQRLAELARANRYSLAGELAATISHEINQPLGAILTNSEALEAMLQLPAPNLSELKEIAADIRRDDQRASEVIRHLRNLLRRAPLELKDVDLNEPVRDAIHFFSTLAIARDAQFSSSFAPTPLPVKGNAVQLHQVVLNLIVNAMDAMSNLPVDQRKLAIVTMRVEKSAEVSVSDTGPGVPPDKLKEIFAPFFSTKEEGMGMGLSIARTIIEAHGGQIWAENQAGRGAIFHIRLPLATLPDRPSLAILPTNASSTSVSGSKMAEIRS
jgi:signal transduction histidine kinase